MQPDHNRDAGLRPEDPKGRPQEPSVASHTHTRYYESNLVQPSPERTGLLEASRFTDNTVDPNKQYSALIKKQVQGCMSSKVVSERVQVKVALL